MQASTLAQKLEVHYYFSDGSHTMNAYVRNRCEAELLHIINDTIHALGLGICIDVEPPLEGGFRDWWKLSAEDVAHASLAISALALLLQFISYLDARPDTQLQQQQKELTELSIKEKKLAIEKLTLELKEQGKPTEESLNAAVRALDSDPKIRLRKSNFYKYLNSYEKVTKVGFSGLDSNGERVIDELFVERTSFKNFILKPDEIPPIIIDNASIEIVSPVLKEGDHRWKGIYDKRTISFSMSDPDFKSAVLGEQVSFQHGSVIECVLEIKQKLNESGEIVAASYAVKTVLRKVDSGSIVETIQGRRFRQNKRQSESQSDLFPIIGQGTKS